MAYHSTTFNVLIASPSDLQEDRDRVERAIHDWNDLHAEEMGITLQPRRWETSATPEQGERPQAIINKQIVEKADLLVGLFWTRLGTHTGVAESGTVEEIEEVAKANKPIMLYFSKRKVDPSKIQADQHALLQGFMKEAMKKGLPSYYNSLDHLYNRLLRDLTRRVRMMKENVGAASEKNVMIPPILHSSIEMATARRDRLITKLRLGEYRGLNGGVTAALAIYPVKPCSVNIEFASNMILPFYPLKSSNGASWHNDSESMYFSGKNHDGTTQSITELFEDGFVFAALDAEVERLHKLAHDMAKSFNQNPPEAVGITFAEIEASVVAGAHTYMTSLRERVGYCDELLACFAIFGLKGKRIYPAGTLRDVYSSKSSPCQDDERIGGWHKIVADANVGDPQFAAQLFRKDFRSVWRHAGYPNDPCFINGVFVSQSS